MRRVKGKRKVLATKSSGWVIAKSARGEASTEARDEIDGGVEGHSVDWAHVDDSVGGCHGNIARVGAQGYACTVRHRYMHKWWDGAWIRRYLVRTPVPLGNKIAAAAALENLVLSSTTIPTTAIDCLNGNSQVTML